MVDETESALASDRFEIQSALLRYARGVDRLDEDLITSAYHPDAEDFRGSPAPGFIGADAGRALVERMRNTCDSSFHSITNMLIEVDGDSAWAESYFQVWQSKATSDGTRQLQVCGRYADRLERRDSGWKIARRVCLIDFSSSTTLPGQYRPPLAVSGLRSRDDPSYRRD
jgi:hypothetical protein